ncbi:MAG: glycine cleavage system aminomethyltransferase GcvT [Candidatus Hodarchaeales archaeon]
MKTQLYEWHSKNGDTVNFAGFLMPVMYSSIKKEHLAVRNAAGLFDVSHMGRIWINGGDSEKFLNILVPRDLSKTRTGRASYTFMLNEQGGFRDDLVFERINSNKWLLIWNAGNLAKISSWMNTIKKILDQFSELDVGFEDISQTSAMFALQGPKAREILASILHEEVEPPGAWSILETTIEEVNVIISGTGYSGEAGFEIIVLNTTNEDPLPAEKIWTLILKSGEPHGILPCGLGARDSLRLEAGYPLYGNDINEFTDPIEADLFFPPFIHMEKNFFIGQKKLEELSKKRPDKIRIGFKALNKGPSPRAGTKLHKDGKEIGTATSGGFSPLLNIGIGMGYVSSEVKDEGTIIQFEVRGKLHEARIEKFPIFNPEKYGSKRKV